VAGADVGEAIALHPSAASRPVLGRDINALSKFYRSQKPKNNGVLSD
jgi:hypothetical protein